MLLKYLKSLFRLFFYESESTDGICSKYMNRG